MIRLIDLSFCLLCPRTLPRPSSMTTVSRSQMWRLPLSRVSFFDMSKTVSSRGTEEQRERAMVMCRKISIHRLAEETKVVVYLQSRGWYIHGMTVLNSEGLSSRRTSFCYAIDSSRSYTTSSSFFATAGSNFPSTSSTIVSCVVPQTIHGSSFPFKILLCITTYSSTRLS